MVERKLRPAPSTLHLLPSRKPVKPGSALPTKLFELDANKKGVSEVARNARQVSRFLDELVTAHGETGESIAKGIPLEGQSNGAATGRLYLQTEAIAATLPATLASGKADNQILGVVMHLAQHHPKRSVILV